MDDTELLEVYGWRVEARQTKCGTPLQIQHKDTGSRAVGGDVVKLVIEALRARRSEYEEQELYFDSIGRL